MAGGSNLYMGTAALSERDYVHEAVDRADLIITIGHDTVEKPPFIMNEKGPHVVHIGATPATVEWIIDKAIQVHGAAGLSQDFPLASAFAGIRTLRFADGPDEVHKNALARAELARQRSRRSGSS